MPKTAQDTLLSMFGIQNERNISEGHALFSVRALAVTWNKLPTLYAVQQIQIPVQNSTQNHTIPLSPWTRLLNILFHTPPPSRFTMTCLYRCVRAAHMSVCMCACAYVCVARGWKGGGQLVGEGLYILLEG